MAEGSYQELQVSDFDFAKLLRTQEDSQVESTVQSDSVSSKCRAKGSIMSIRNSNQIISPSVDESKANLILNQTNEKRESGSSRYVSKSVSMSYFSAGGSTSKLFFFFLTYIVTQVLTSGSDYWISVWYSE